MLSPKSISFYDLESFVGHSNSMSDPFLTSLPGSTPSSRLFYPSSSSILSPFSTPLAPIPAFPAFTHLNINSVDLLFLEIQSNLENLTEIHLMSIPSLHLSSFLKVDSDALLISTYPPCLDLEFG